MHMQVEPVRTALHRISRFHPAQLGPSRTSVVPESNHRSCASHLHSCRPRSERRGSRRGVRASGGLGRPGPSQSECDLPTHATASVTQASTCEAQPARGPVTVQATRARKCHSSVSWDRLPCLLLRSTAPPQPFASPTMHTGCMFVQVRGLETATRLLPAHRVSSPAIALLHADIPA
jgi:hypothetical protein